MKAQEFIEKQSIQYKLAEFDEGGFLGIDETLLEESLEKFGKIKAFEFAMWIGKNNYQLVPIYSIYERGTDGFEWEITPKYETLVATKWTTCDDIPEIMVDNNNEELEWCLTNSYTEDELYNLFLNSK